MSWLQNIKKVTPGGQYSQYGEEAFLLYIFSHIGTLNQYYVDIGANDGKWLSNTRVFHDKGWQGLMIDGAHENELVKKHFVTRENVTLLLRQYEVPEEFDLLSIDIDGIDFYVLNEILTHFRPRVIISEYNSELDPGRSVTIKYDPAFKFEGNLYYGYTMRAGEKLAETHGYKIIHQHTNLNLFYVRADLLPDEVIHVPNRKFKWWGGKTDKQWEEI